MSTFDQLTHTRSTNQAPLPKLMSDEIRLTGTEVAA